MTSRTGPATRRRATASAAASAPPSLAPRAPRAPRAAPPAARTGRSRAADDGAVSEPAARVLRRFRLVFNTVKTHFQQVEKQTGIGGAQLWALSVIRARPGIGVGALARAMDVHQTTASNLVRALVAAGLAAAEKNGSDRRTVQLRVLTAGLRLLRRAPGPFEGVLPSALDQLDAAVLRRLERDLDLLIAVLHPDRRDAGIPLGQSE